LNSANFQNFRFPATWTQWPKPDGEIKQAMLEAYSSGSWGQYHGGYVDQLESLLAKFHGVKHALVCSSGTVAVHIALEAIQAQDGAEVILAGYDFPGNFRCIQQSRMFPVLVDIDPSTWSLSVQDVQEAITDQTVAIIASHLHGGMAAMEMLEGLARMHGLATIEDACQATGAITDGRVAGAVGDWGVISFGGSKLLTAGRGGALLTNRGDLYQRAKIYCERGNHAFPLSELQAAVLIPQFRKLAASNDLRNNRVNWLKEKLSPYQHLLQFSNNDASVDVPGLYKTGMLFSDHDLMAKFYQAAIRAEAPFGTGFKGFVKRPGSQCRQASSLEHSSTAAHRTLLLDHPILMEESTAIETLADWVIYQLQHLEQK